MIKPFRYILLWNSTNQFITVSLDYINPKTPTQDNKMFGKYRLPYQHLKLKGKLLFPGETNKHTQEGVGVTFVKASTSDGRRDS